MVDNFYFFDKSTKRKSGLAEYCTFCDIQYRKILKHVSTRWLSLELAIDRTLRQYPALQSFFLSESKCISCVYYCLPNILLSINLLTLGSTCDRFNRLREAYSNPMTEVYLMFFQSVLQLFVALNKFLQREDPIIPVVCDQLHAFMKKLFGKFVTVSAIRASKRDINGIEYAEEQLPGLCFSLIHSSMHITVCMPPLSYTYAHTHICHTSLSHIPWHTYIPPPHTHTHDYVQIRAFL